jgi:putative ABC transport system substrate-binding protein
MKRREFIGLLGGAAVAWPLAARGQRAEKIYRIGVLETTPLALNAPNFDALRSGLRDLGYVEGQNLIILYRSADGRAEKFLELAEELVGLNVDLIVTRGTPAAIATKKATATIPIVSAATGEPITAGLAASLAHPGGNFTGLTSISSEIEEKQIELVRELVPGVVRVAFLYNMANPIYPVTWRQMETLLRPLGIDPRLFDVRTAGDLGPAFDTAHSQPVGVVLVGMDGLIQANRQAIIELAREHRVPAVYPSREFVEAGGLIAYGVSYADLYRRAASYIDKILKGASPADLPIERPTKFEMTVNLKAAKAIGLTVPESFLLRADEVIE